MRTVSYRHKYTRARRKRPTYARRYRGYAPRTAHAARTYYTCNTREHAILPRVRAVLCLLIALYVMFAPEPFRFRRPPDDIGPARFAADPEINVYDTTTRHIARMPLEEYVARSVAAEMPASYETEALKAQAVAVRTRAIAGHCAKHPAANVCTDSGCCQAYINEAGMRRKWGDSFERFYKRIVGTVNATRGEIITFDGEPILVLYHAVSGGRTEDVEMVYAQALPYLRSVSSPGEEGASRYANERVYDRASFANAVSAAVKGAGLNAAGLEKQVEVLARSESGRVLRMRVGNKEITGRDFRGILGLNSTNFTLAYTDKSVIISEIGYGHGIGMSQAGANAMAKSGADYTQIIRHYYTGVDISRLDEL